jgi:hypothetical protein
MIIEKFSFLEKEIFSICLIFRKKDLGRTTCKKIEKYYAPIASLAA